MISIPLLYQIYLKHPVICIDTRKITPGSIFVALKGDNFNANQFAENAVKAGAAYALIDDPAAVKSDQYLLVENTLETLQQLALYHREKLTIPFIGITGTNGKTTTKELLYSVLSQHFKTYATQGNLNNHIGVPLTILALSNDIEIAIIEMGANHVGEIAFLCGIAKPTHGLITNVGKAHLEGFGSFDGVKKAKGELYAYLSLNKSLAFVNRDNHFLVDMARDSGLTQIAYYGTGNNNYISGELVNGSPLTVTWRKNYQEADALEHTTISNLTGIYNVENILAAVCAANYFKLSPVEINKGITEYQPVNNRSQIKQTDKNLIICDYYNANPSSMAVALDNLESISAKNKVIILGDMFELGEDTFAEHEIILHKALSIKAQRRIFVGNEFYKHKNSQGEFYTNTLEAFNVLQTTQMQDSTILLKGSRGMKFEALAGLF
ncbi:MAG TPA: UDP-N-acetylmuramoyl-tripeptide--D-alanyl-D-alanine ligase [Sphingobacteriaceae bacterium]|nr:UDP-N-acetylmuramoyl-tripeptide--D-alanyl-D-alanine ligase [Sphingobacteriaceae bacterium]